LRVVFTFRTLSVIGVEKAPPCGYAPAEPCNGASPP
jgi:hypothetical protein